MEHVVDARGHRCPTPTLRLRRALALAADGEVVVLICDDPMARIDAPHFVTGAGHDLLGVEERDGRLAIRVRKRASAADAGRGPPAG